MDSEPGRCRRTDGRKWRCSQSVVLGQKYCERHLHRGRQGSRKHVEPKEHVAKSDNNKILDDNKSPAVAIGIDNRINVSDGADCNPAKHCCSNGNVNPTIVDKSCEASVVADSAILGLEVNKNGNSIPRLSINSINNSATDETNCNKSGFGNLNCTKINRRKPCVTRNSYHGFVSPGFGLSPKSVLHSRAGKPGLDCDSKSISETEQQRCRRTDGKKWQCRRDTVPGQKYCDAHMHRGAKRVTLNPESASNVPNTSARNSACISGIVAGLPGYCINLNTLPLSPQHKSGNNSTSVTSDTTTITDENISFGLKHPKG